MPKRTYQPKKAHRGKRHGFLKRMLTRGGQDAIKRRRQKQRRRLTL